MLRPVIRNQIYIGMLCKKTASMLFFYKENDFNCDVSAQFGFLL